MSEQTPSGDQPQPRIKAYVADRADAAPSAGAAPEDEESILDHELRFIMQRRRHMAASGAREATIRSAEGKRDIEDVDWPDDLAGLAFSGGGIRSSTFCLGVAQALHRHGVIGRLDYLSTVSGGSYFGSALTATLIQSKGKFVFGGQSLESAGGTAPKDQLSSDDLRDSKAVGHLRNYSNYLVPKGLWDWVTAAAIIMRGLVSNAAMVLWIPFLFAAITVASNPQRDLLAVPGFLGMEVGWYPLGRFGLTSVVAGVAFLAFLLWALVRSGHAKDDLPDVDVWEPKLAALVLILVILTAFCEFQPIAIGYLFDSADRAEAEAASTALATAGSRSLSGWIVAGLATLMTFVTFFSETLKTYLADTYYAKTWSAMLARGSAAAVMWAGALALPVLIWIFYLSLCYWAIADGDPALDSAFAHSPTWFVALKQLTGGSAWQPYAAVAALLVFSAFWLKPNANSLHNLYRDRLARAFHFDPATLPVESDEKLALSPQREKDPDPIRRNLQEMLSPDAPYHLINTAINVGSSTQANRRGRNADFFVLSPLFVGSRVTGYIPTYAYSDRGIGEPVDLAKAVAISGAAASSNMGSQTIKPLSPTLAMLNVRLGYWMTNPASVVGRLEWARRTRILGDRKARLQAGGVSRRRSRHWTRTRQAFAWFSANGLWFLFAEMFGVMKEHHSYVYLTDGGHIENLGIYELLRRRCKVIVAVDAEADPQMRFGSFITLQIYARIDLGIRIDLPVEAIRDATHAAMATGKKREDKATAPAERDGPHIAIGRIDYGDNEFGTLVYVKASLSGDENDYVRDYGRRNPLFPHESTGDQFFTEEQFEVYRALGFHSMSHFLSGADRAIVSGDRKPALRTINDKADPRVADIWRVLGPF